MAIGLPVGVRLAISNTITCVESYVNGYMLIKNYN